MKIKINKWIGLTGIFVLLVSLSSCVKDRNELGTDFSNLQDHVLLISGGLANFTSANIRFNNDTANLTLTANLASVNLPTSPVKVTIAIDSAKIATYNTANNKNYQLLPAAAYKLTTTILTIPSGQQYASTTIEFYKGILDPSVSYLLPISIMDASGKALSSNQNTIYYNVIGNVLAGSYSVVGTRYNYSGVIGYTGGAIPGGFASSAVSPTPKIAAPVDAKTITIDYANLGSTRQYIISYDPAVSTTNLDVTFTPSFLAGISNVNVIIHTYDPVTKKIHILSTYNNQPGGAGDDRVIDEVLTKM
ncbi:MAG: DUF1735 domain-containing protein [Ferruginibacter sp.]